MLGSSRDASPSSVNVVRPSTNISYCMSLNPGGRAARRFAAGIGARTSHRKSKIFFRVRQSPASRSNFAYCMHRVMQSLLLCSSVLCANFRDAHRTSRMLGELQRFSLTIAELFAMGPVSLEIFLMRANFYKIFLEIARSQNMIFDLQ